MEFSPLIKGTPDWNEKYNQDIGGLCAEMDAARSSGILNTYVHAKSGTAHTLTGEGAIMRFTATAGWAAGDTISVNGLGKNPVALEGTALPAGAFAQGTQVVAVVDGENLQFLTQSYAGQFDAISTQMSNKADKNRALQSDLYAQYARDVQAPNLNITPEILFNNPPLDNMALLDHRAKGYPKANRPAGAPPMSSTMIAQHFEILTFRTDRNRALQVATQCYTGDDNGRVFLRTRDNNDFSYTGWQAWKEVATCVCADMEWKELPMTDRFIYWNDDKSLRLQYRKGYDAIYVAGVIKPAEGVTLAYDELIATLPAGYRPSRLWYQLCALSGGGYFCRIRVDKGGSIVISGYDPDGAGAIKNSIEIYLTIPL